MSRGGGPGCLLEVEKCLLSWGRCGGRGPSAVASITGRAFSRSARWVPPRGRPLWCVARPVAGAATLAAAAVRRWTAPGKKFQLRFHSKSLTPVQEKGPQSVKRARAGTIYGYRDQLAKLQQVVGA